jgi:hypothetical protein
MGCRDRVSLEMWLFYNIFLDLDQVVELYQCAISPVRSIACGASIAFLARHAERAYVNVSGAGEAPNSSDAYRPNVIAMCGLPSIRLTGRDRFWRLVPIYTNAHAGAEELR